jgi:hypothetical protein
MHTIHQVSGGWEVRKGDQAVKFFPLRNFEIHSDSLGYLQAVNFIRKADGHGTYFDFTRFTVKSSKF